MKQNNRASDNKKSSFISLVNTRDSPGSKAKRKIKRKTKARLRRN